MLIHKDRWGAPIRIEIDWAMLWEDESFVSIRHTDSSISVYLKPEELNISAACRAASQTWEAWYDKAHEVFKSLWYDWGEWQKITVDEFISFLIYVTDWHVTVL